MTRLCTQGPGRVAFTGWRLPSMLLATAFIAGCSNVEDKVYDIMKCAKVATHLGKRDLARNAIGHIQQYEQELNKRISAGSRSMSAIAMNQRVEDDLALHRYATEGKVQILTEVFQSSTCQGYYQPA